jgi:Hydrazine synthase alpha subunit middle domain
VVQGLGQTRVAASVCFVMAFFVGFVFVHGAPSAFSQNVPTKQRIASTANLPDIVFVQTPEIVAGPLAQRFPQGSAIVRLNFSKQPTRVVPLTDGFFSAADPQISFDGARILYSAQQRQNERWQVWEMDADGSNKRQITHCGEDCLRPAYLPAGEIAITVEGSTVKLLRSYLAVAKTDGSEFHRITFGDAPFQLETVLRDGRIVASAPWPLAAGDKSTTRMLYTLRPDGTALESFRCNHNDVSIQARAEELSDGSLVFVRKSQADATASGELAQIERGAPHATTLSIHQRAFESARQISEKQLVVAKLSGNGTTKFDLYLFDLKAGTIGERLHADPQLSSVQPAPVIARAIPKHYWDTLNAASSTGNFISLNSYSSADVSHGRIAAPISRVRVFAMTPPGGQERTLGDAPVEADGSFFVEVPANWPVRFALLDANGHIIREEHSWIWTRPGEQRGCTGCHGDKAVAPENHWPQTLQRFDTPTPLGDINHGSTTSPAK